MRTALALRDHAHVHVHHAVARATLVGGLGGIACAVAPEHPAVDAITLLGLGLAVVVPRTLRSAAVAAALAAGTVGSLVVASQHGERLLAALALAWGATLYARDAVGSARRVAALGGGVVALLAAAFVRSGLRGELALAMTPAFSGLLAGAGAGLVAGLGVLGRELEVVDAQPLLPSPSPGGGFTLHAPDDGDPRARDAPPEQRELLDLLGRARAAASALAADPVDAAPDAVARAADVVARLETFAARYADTERQLATLDRVALVARREQLEARAATIPSDEARADYARAALALARQLDEVDAIRAGQARALARLHDHVATVERLRLSAIHRRAAEEGLREGELRALVDELAAAAVELEGAAVALAELPA